MGFSFVGLTASLLVLLPNLVAVVAPPRDGFAEVALPRPLVWGERAAQAACLTVPALTAGATDLRWAPAYLTALRLYCALWIRYLVRGRRLRTLYDTVFGVPVPMAVAPVVAFASIAGLVGSLPALVAAVALAATHLPVAWLTGRGAR